LSETRTIRRYSEITADHELVATTDRIAIHGSNNWLWNPSHQLERQLAGIEEGTRPRKIEIREITKKSASTKGFVAGAGQHDYADRLLETRDFPAG
jgi:hypothetical protein